tara:strand:+ start:489 stop:1235 length:747 start_codon:yes stop_codon:yes gene_type:complete
MENAIKKLIECGMLGIKTSFEDEGQTFDKIIKLRDITTKNGLKLVIKIGGCEAKSDVKMAEKLLCDQIISPMVESKYAVKKFKLIDTKLPKGINLETNIACSNVDDILKESDDMNFFVIGRVDLVGSLYKDRSIINDKEIYDICFSVFTKIRKKYGNNVKIGMGGSINKNSLKFIKDLYENGLLDYVETRFIIFDVETLLQNYNKGIYNANVFEVQWLQYQNMIDSQDINLRKNREIMISKRIAEFNM